MAELVERFSGSDSSLIRSGGCSSASNVRGPFRNTLGLVALVEHVRNRALASLDLRCALSCLLGVRAPHGPCGAHACWHSTAHRLAGARWLRPRLTPARRAHRSRTACRLRCDSLTKLSSSSVSPRAMASDSPTVASENPSRCSIHGQAMGIALAQRLVLLENAGLLGERIVVGNVIVAVEGLVAGRCATQQRELWASPVVCILLLSDDRIS
jgi:hypothetical protein